MGNLVGENWGRVLFRQKNRRKIRGRGGFLKGNHKEKKPCRRENYHLRKKRQIREKKKRKKKRGTARKNKEKKCEGGKMCQGRRNVILVGWKKL